MKLCKDCLFFQKNEFLDKVICSHPLREVEDLVYGNRNVFLTSNPYKLRRDENACGINAKWFDS